MPGLILASSSPRRRELLKQIRLSFKVKDPRVPEDADGKGSASPTQTARRLALRKARAVQARHPDAVILAADTVVCLGRRLLGKPATRREATRMLKALSGKKHRVITAVAVLYKTRTRLRTAATEVWFYPLSSRFIRSYVGTGEPLDKAGGYGIQGMGALCVKRIRGDYFNVVGLPLASVWRLLLEVGWLDRPEGIPAQG